MIVWVPGIPVVVAFIKEVALSVSVPLITSPVWKVPEIESSPKVNSVTSLSPNWNLDTASTNAVALEVWPVIVLPIKSDVSPVVAIALKILFVVELNDLGGRSCINFPIESIVSN